MNYVKQYPRGYIKFSMEFGTIIVVRSWTTKGWEKFDFCDLPLEYLYISSSLEPAFTESNLSDGG